MYTVKVRTDFSSAHSLRGYKGKCEALHGHNWQVELAVKSQGLDGIGMVIDFGELKTLLNEVLGELDHKNLNDLESFKEANPTSENIARFIYRKIKEKKTSLNIAEVTVWETPSSSATYSTG